MDVQNKSISPKEHHMNENETGVETMDVLNHFENEEIVYADKLCRLCANVIKTGIYYIFNEDGKEQQLAYKINTCLPVTVKKTDCLPKQLCLSCKIKLNICYNFAEICINAEKKLTKIVQIHPVNLNCVNSSDNITSNHKKLYCPLCFEGCMIPEEDVCGTNKVCSENLQVGRNGEVFNNTEHVVAMEVPESSKHFISSVKGIQIDDSLDHNISNITVVCCICDQSFPDMNSSVAHSYCHSNESGVPCVLCGKYLNDNVLVEKHYKTHKLEIFNQIKSMQVESSKENNNLSNTTKLYKCSECNEIFRSAERLSFHDQFHKESRQLECEWCRKEFTNENLLFHHMYSVHGGTEMCTKCGATFMSKVILDTHTCSHVEQPFQCKICKKEFQDTIELKKHTSTHTSFQCNECDASFTHISSLHEHLKNVHSLLGTPQCCMICNICKAVFPNMDFAILHYANNHSSSELAVDMKNIEEIEVTELFCCEYCEELFSHKDHFSKHCSEHSGFDPYYCTFCNLFFSEYSQLKFHKRYHFEYENQVNQHTLFSASILFICKACNRSFYSAKGLQIHNNILHNKQDTCNSGQTSHEESKSCQLCEDCGESFKRRIDLRRHRMKMHRPKNQFPCEDCGKVLMHYSGLIIHRRQHTGEKPFICDVCGKGFPQSPAMYIHRRTHTRDYPYRCEMCERAFNNKEDLDNHRRSKHTKERPFKCNVCNKSFLTSGVYYQHRQLHAGIRKYKCMYCERAFNRSTALSIHIRSHTGEKPHACLVCGRRFSQKGDMKKHMKTQHGVSFAAFSA